VTTGIPAFLPVSDQSAALTRAVIRHVQKTEHEWFAQGDPASPTLPWMPFQSADFLSIVFECVPELAGRNFLDVGCGPGTKMLLASHFYGLQAQGIEINSAMAAAAMPHGGVFPQDALEMAPGFYQSYDLIWLYRPFRGQELEEKLEQRIMTEMKPGAILAGGSWENCPSEHGWLPVVDDWELRRGAWMKPAS
jgi:SAM-dependent methyltransferase